MILRSWSLVLLAVGLVQVGHAYPSYSGRTMGTTYTIKSSKKVDLESVDRILNLLNQEVSTYIPDSQISRVSSSLGPHVIGEDFYRILEYSLSLAELSEGVFDPTIGPLVRLWGFGPRTGPQKKPQPHEVSEQMKRVGYAKLSVKKVGASFQVHKQKDDIEIDLSATAKGYGVDKIYEYLLAEGHEDFMVEIGGEIRVHGKNASKKEWTLGIEAPNKDRRSLQRVLSIKSTQALATSGDYRNFFNEKGETFSHTIDTKTGYPVQHLLTSASVIAATCMEADGLATTLMALGPKRAQAFVEKNNIAAMLIIQTDSKPLIYESKAFQKLNERSPL